MNLEKELSELETINVGFDVLIAKNKVLLIDGIMEYLEENYNLISVKNKKRILEQVYGIYYEMGNLKQAIKPRADIQLMKRALPLAKSVFGQTKELLPYLYSNLHIEIGNERECKLIQNEIDIIESGKNELQTD
jgi:hypothetical protein